LSFKVYHHWSTGSGGVVKVWLNGALKATISGPNLFIGYESTPYQKGGIYRSSSGITRDSQLWIDNVRWSKSDPG
jgi:Polysaccharide lyase